MFAVSTISPEFQPRPGTPRIQSPAGFQVMSAWCVSFIGWFSFHLGVKGAISAATPATSRVSTPLVNPRTTVCRTGRGMGLSEPARSRSVRRLLAASSSARPTSFRAFLALGRRLLSSGFNVCSRQAHPLVLPLMGLSGHEYSFFVSRGPGQRDAPRDFPRPHGFQHARRVAGPR